MIRGRVNDRLEAVVRITIRKPGGPEVEVDIDAILDTGYTGALKLAQGTVDALELERSSPSAVRLADGSMAYFHSYEAEIRWGEGYYPILVAAFGDESLVGMRLLDGCGLWVEVVEGGPVEIAPLA